jgi:MFS family permease
MGFFRHLYRDYSTAFGLFTPNVRLFLLGNLLLGIGSNMVQLLLNLYLKRLGMNEEAIGTILAFRAFGSFAIALPASLVIARMDSRFLLSSAAVLTATAFAGQGLMQGFGPITASVMFSGAFASLYQVAAGPFFMKNSGQAERIHLFALNGALSMGTGVIGSLVGGVFKDLIQDATGDELYAYRMTLILGSCFVASAVAPFLGIRGNPGPGWEKGSGAARYRSVALGKIDVRLFARLLVPGFFVGMGAGLTIPYLNLYFKNEFALGDSAIGLIFALGQVGTFIGMVSGPVIAGRTGKAWAIFLTQAISVPFILVLTYLKFLPLVVVAFIARQSLMNTSTPIADNFALEQVPPEQQHLMNALKMLNWTGSWMVSARISGSIIATRGFAPSFTLTAALYALSSVLFWWFFLARRGSRTAARS